MSWVPDEGGSEVVCGIFDYNRRMAPEVSVSFAASQLGILFVVLLAILCVVFYRAHSAQTCSSGVGRDEDKQPSKRQDQQEDRPGDPRAIPHWAPWSQGGTQRPAQP